MSKIQDNYTDILTYSGLKGLRSERAMYLGAYNVLSEGHSPRALIQTAQEVVSNSIDEILAGAGDKVIITINEDNSISIQDFGRGMPKGPEDSFDSVIRSLTVPHSSGKFRGSSYAAQGTAGMHGIGLKATAATAEWFRLHAISKSTKLNDDETNSHTGGFEEYEILIRQDTILETKILNTWDAKDVEILDINKFKVISTGEEITTGTIISYLPDNGPVSDDDEQLVFEDINWKVKDLFPRFESSAFLNAGVKIEFVDKRVIVTDDDDNSNYLTKNWYFKDGITEYVTNLSKSLTLLSKLKKPIHFDQEYELDNKNYRVQLALIITDESDTNISSFANGVPTKDGGPHVNGFNLALTKAFNDYAKEEGLNKVKGKGKSSKNLGRFTKNDVLEGITGVFEIRIPSDLTHFEGQTKEKLAVPQAETVMNSVVYKFMMDWLYDNKDAAEQIITKIIESKQASDAAIRAREESRKLRNNKSLDRFKISSKFKPATGNNPEKNEYYITEGDSASNIGLDQSFQALMPLRGKIINVDKSPLKDVLANAEILALIEGIGTGIGANFNYDNLKYHKIIIACDADADGGHITMLLLTFFKKFMRPLIEKGHIYIAKPPLYKVYKYVNGNKTDIKWFYKEEDIDKERNYLSENNYTIQRFKGLGEMDPDEVYKAIGDVKTRHLEKASLSDVNETIELFRILMGNSAALRREWTSENINYNDFSD